MYPHTLHSPLLLLLHSQCFHSSLTLPSSSTVITPSLSQSNSLKASFKQSMSSLESCLSGLSLSVFLVIVWQCEHHKMTRCVLTTGLTCSKLTASRGKSPDPGTHSDTLPLPNIDNIKLVSRTGNYSNCSCLTSQEDN